MRAHPRSRGENLGEVEDADAPPGSSPLTRGKQPASVYLVFMMGLIPAHAGKTGGSASMARAIVAHPRSRGENT